MAPRPRVSAATTYRVVLVNDVALVILLIQGKHASEEGVVEASQPASQTGAPSPSLRSRALQPYVPSALCNHLSVDTFAALEARGTWKSRRPQRTMSPAETHTFFRILPRMWPSRVEPSKQ